MNWRSGGTSTWLANCICNLVRSFWRRSGKMSAMATSLTGPRLMESALAAAPPPRPPQPIKATWIRSLPAAWTAGMATLAKAEAAANLPVFLMNSRRDAETCMDDFMAVQFPYTYGYLFEGTRKASKTRYVILARVPVVNNNLIPQE